MARFWADASASALSADSVHTAKRCILDTVGVGIAGAATELGDIVFRGTAGSRGGGGTAVVWGRSETVSPVEAALINGTAAHVLELDDYWGCGHSGAVVVPAVLSLVNDAACSGTQVLTAIVAGYDVAARVLDAAAGYREHNLRGWHSTGTCGSFGAAAGASKLLNLSRDAFADSLGIAGSFTGGIWAFLVDGAATKRLHAGRAAEMGLSAALLAQAGMSGPRFVLEAEWGGFFSTYVPGNAQPSALLAGIGTNFKIMETGIKPHSCCRGIHPAIDAVQQIMREASADWRAITEMIVHGDQQTVRQFNRHEVATLLDAQFSIPYCLAVTAESGHARFDQFRTLRTGDPIIQKLMAMTRVVDDRTLRSEDDILIELRLTGGRVFERTVEVPKGEPKNPLSDSELIDKFDSLVAPLIGTGPAKEIASACMNADRERDFRRVMRLLACPGLKAAQPA